MHEAETRFRIQTWELLHRKQASRNISGWRFCQTGDSHPSSSWWQITSLSACTSVHVLYIPAHASHYIYLA